MSIPSIFMFPPMIQEPITPSQNPILRLSVLELAGGILFQSSHIRRLRMWIFMMVMMATVSTRKRSEEASEQHRMQSRVDGSESESRPPSTRKRNRRLPGTTDQPPVDEPNRRGPSINRSAINALDNLPEGSKISLTIAPGTKNFVGASSTQFATECGIVIRSVCPMMYHKWELVPDDVKTQMYEKLQVRFNLLRTDKGFMEHVDSRLHAQWKRTRGTLSDHWKSNGGYTNLELARSKMKPSCRSEEDWNHMCDYWELESTRKYNKQMEVNRSKQVITSRGGSRSIANHVFQMTNQTQVTPTPFEVYYNLHFNAKKKGWLNDHARVEYENILRHKDEAMVKLTSEGMNITADIERELEKKAIKSVCAKKQTIKSAWEVGVGPVLRKKDQWMLPNSSQPPSSETENLQNQVVALKEELKQNQEKLRQSNEQYERMSMFMTSKFPDFENVVSASASNGGNGSSGQLNESDNEDMI